MKILIVDDEPAANFILSRLLKLAAPEAQIVDYTLPAKAFGDLPSIEPDVIFLDINMPDMNGWAFLDKMAKMGMNYKVIIISSTVSSVDRAKAGEYPIVNRCLSKPVRRDQLKACLYG